MEKIGDQQMHKKLKLVTIIIVFTASVSSIVQTSEQVPGVATKSSPEEAERALLDYEAELRISPRIVSLVPEYYSSLKICSKRAMQTACEAEFELFIKNYATKAREGEKKPPSWSNK